MSQPDLFVVCKNCGSEVSPYVTECPYCGQRVRKRAPKLDKGAPTEPRARRRPRLPRLRADEIEGIAPDVRPWATMFLIAASLITTLVYAADNNLDTTLLGTIAVPGFDEPWRWVTAPFVHLESLGYQFVALAAVALFGTMLERRFGPVPVIFLFLACGTPPAPRSPWRSTCRRFDEPAARGRGRRQRSGAWNAGGVAGQRPPRRAARRRARQRHARRLRGRGRAGTALGGGRRGQHRAAAGGAVAGALLAPALPLFTRSTAY